MKLVPLHTIFKIFYGNSLDLNRLEEADITDEDAVNYVSRTRENNGISAIVKRIEDIIPFSSGLITVAGSGNSVLESFIQPYPFYTGYHVFILEPKSKMTDEEKLFYCFCIQSNQYKYSFGRQANKTLKDILVPVEIPKQFQKSIKDLNKIQKKPILENSMLLDAEKWGYIMLSKIFSFERGKEIINKCEPGTTALVSSTEKDNGINSYIEGNFVIQGNVITVAINGSIGEAFYQEKQFYATTDVIVLRPKFSLSKYSALFLCTIIRSERYRFNFGRKWGYDRMKDFEIKLPSKNGKPDFEFMEDYIKSLPYSSSI